MFESTLGIFGNALFYKKGETGRNLFLYLIRQREREKKKHEQEAKRKQKNGVISRFSLYF